MLVENSQTLSDETFSNDIILGNPAADHTITIVLSAYCSFCENLISDIKDFVCTIKSAKVILRFSSNNPLNNEFTSHLLIYSAKNNHLDTFQFIKKWYGLKEKNIDAFVSKAVSAAPMDYNLVVGGKQNWEGY